MMPPDVGTDLTVGDLERLPKLEGYDHELNEGRLRIAVAAPRLYAHAGVPTYCLVERHPEDECDGLVKIHQLTPTGYPVARTIPLSELEAGA